MATNARDLNKQAKEILEIAEKWNVEGNFFFSTTFKRYLEQINILSELEKAWKEEGATVSKEYVKGRKNLYVNPAITEYNKTSTAANNTVGTLIKIIESMRETDEDAARELLEFIQGRKK